MQILTDTHSHTIASTHAYSTVQELLEAAKARGLQAFCLTDHAPPMPDAPHFWHFLNRRVIPPVIDNVAILRGMEANIEADGIHVPERILAGLDMLIASFHEPVFAPSDRLSHTKAMIAAISSGHCQIIGHPGNPKYPIEIDEVILAAKAHNVLLEINNSSFGHSRAGSAPHCLKLLERIAHHDWKVSFGSDAHISYDIGRFEHCIAAALQVGFAPEHVVNATPQRLLRFLAEHNKSVASDLAGWLSQLPD
ncbi:phosphatase [Ferrimonas pelagia]|uniref:Phosphatase n=1 Tax=Ferrimonas pelagia TaxID=1177826 RepID=A0ABP9FB73_9GAMM